MSTLFISLLTLLLLLISVFVILLVLMQRTSQSGGMGGALGGGATESAFGSDTTNVLTKSTIYSIIAFFLVALGLFLIYQSEAADRVQVINASELISGEELKQSADILTVVEDVPSPTGELEGTSGAVPESIEVTDPVVNAEASTSEAVPTSN